jgi:FKBP-type peptidyl-prolyl cis-trans isomerase FklB
MIMTDSPPVTGTPMPKRFPIVLLLVFCLGAASAFAQDQGMTDKEKLSYTVGVQLGKTLLKQPMDIDNPALVQGITDVLDQKGLKLTDQEMREVLMKYRDEQEAKQKVKATENKKKGEAFLAKNKARKGVVALPSGVQYEVLRKGKGKKPTLNDSITVHYEGTLIDGTVFDSSYKRGQPVTLKLNQVIKGWQIAVPKMSVGAKWKLYIPADLAYGDKSPSPVIGPNSTLIFTVELLSIN